MKLEQYLLGEKGVRIDIIRHFRYASIGFYAMKAQGAKSNGGFRFQIALPPYKYRRRGYIPRFTPPETWGWRIMQETSNIITRTIAHHPVTI